MEQVSVIGIDLAKSVFQLEAQSGCGAVVWKKRLRRAAFIRFMEQQAPRCLVGFEACGGAHYWGRFLTGLGFPVKMMAPKAVKAYREGPHKNDGRDAHAAAEAASRAQVRAVRVKSAAAQAVQALVRVRLLQIKQMVQTGNQLRGILAEFGIVMPKGHQRLREAITRLGDDPVYRRLPSHLRAAVDGLRGQLGAQVERVKQATDALAQATKDDPSCELLRSVPALGPINAAGLSVALEAPHLPQRPRLRRLLAPGAMPMAERRPAAAVRHCQTGRQRHPTQSRARRPQPADHGPAPQGAAQRPFADLGAPPRRAQEPQRRRRRRGRQTRPHCLGGHRQG
jgi:transposase